MIWNHFSLEIFCLNYIYFSGCQMLALTVPQIWVRDISVAVVIILTQYSGNILVDIVWSLYYNGCAGTSIDIWSVMYSFFTFFCFYWGVMPQSTSHLSSSAISSTQRANLMRPANTAGLWPKKQCYQCLPAAEGSYLCYLGAILQSVVLHILQSLQRKHWWLLGQCEHRWTSPGFSVGKLHRDVFLELFTTIKRCVEELVW